MTFLKTYISILSFIVSILVVNGCGTDGGQHSTPKILNGTEVPDSLLTRNASGVPLITSSIGFYYGKTDAINSLGFFGTEPCSAVRVGHNLYLGAGPCMEAIKNRTNAGLMVKDLTGILINIAGPKKSDGFLSEGLTIRGHWISKTWQAEGTNPDDHVTFFNVARKAMDQEIDNNVHIATLAGSIKSGQEVYVSGFGCTNPPPDGGLCRTSGGFEVPLLNILGFRARVEKHQGTSLELSPLVAGSNTSLEPGLARGDAGGAVLSVADGSLLGINLNRPQISEASRYVSVVHLGPQIASLKEITDKDHGAFRKEWFSWYHSITTAYGCDGRVTIPSFPRRVQQFNQRYGKDHPARAADVDNICNGNEIVNGLTRFQIDFIAEYFLERSLIILDNTEDEGAGLDEALRFIRKDDFAIFGVETVASPLISVVNILTGKNLSDRLEGMGYWDYLLAAIDVPGFGVLVSKFGRAAMLSKKYQNRSLSVSSTDDVLALDDIVSNRAKYGGNQGIRRSTEQGLESAEDLQAARLLKEDSGLREYKQLANDLDISEEQLVAISRQFKPCGPNGFVGLESLWDAIFAVHDFFFPAAWAQDIEAIKKKLLCRKVMLALKDAEVSGVEEVADALEFLGRAIEKIQLVDGVPPINAIFAGKKFSFDVEQNFILRRRIQNDASGRRRLELLKKLHADYPNGVSFSEKGFPDFSPYIEVDPDGNPIVIDIEFLNPPKKSGSRKDMKRATEEMRKKFPGWKKPNGTTWHHVENSTKLQLIPTDLHDGVRHNGGRSTYDYGNL